MLNTGYTGLGIVREIEDAIMGFAMEECLTALWVLPIGIMHNICFQAWLFTYEMACKVDDPCTLFFMGVAMMG